MFGKSLFSAIYLFRKCQISAIYLFGKFYFVIFITEIQQFTNSLAEIDYLLPSHLNILPIEVKAGNQGGMKSLWSFMREKHITKAVRCSLENFGEFSYTDKEDADAVRHVNVFPLYAVSQIIRSTTSEPQ